MGLVFICLLRTHRLECDIIRLCRRRGEGEGKEEGRWKIERREASDCAVVLRKETRHDK